MRLMLAVVAFCLSASGLHPSGRINHAGRILGPIPVVTHAIPFNTPEADAVVAALQLFPRDNAWNEDISRRPLLPNSDAMIAQIFSELNAVGANSPKLRAFKEMNFILVPADQPPTPISFVTYPEDSDPGPYPIPPNLPIEGWPSETGMLTLDQVQHDSTHKGGDRHSIIIQPGTGFLWETWETVLTGAPSGWEAANGARFNFTNNTLRPAGLTSADAAGLSMLAGLVRFDECARGEIEHALRMIVKHTRREYIYPATHHASSPPTTNPNIPAMGQRLRLKAGFVVPATWTQPERAIAAALKKYGGLIADNSSSFFSISVVPDLRWPANTFSHITDLSITNFEVIQSTKAGEGPRSPGAPVVSAGPDQTVDPGGVVNLSAEVHYTNAAPLTIEWRMYSGPGPVALGSADQARTTAVLTTPGEYTFMVKADDGIHTPAYDAVAITVRETILMTIERLGGTVALGWVGGVAPFELEEAISLPGPPWVPVGTFATNFVLLPGTSSGMFFRVRGR